MVEGPAFLQWLASQPAKNRKTFEKSWTAALEAGVEAQAATREERARRDEQRAPARENKPRSSAVQSPERFP